MFLFFFAFLQFESKGITVTAKQFRDLPYQVQTIKVDRILTISNLGEFLEKKAGVGIEEYGSPGSLTQVVALGLSPSHTLTLLNGHRISDPKTGGFDLSAIPLNSVKRIEIIKGPSSVFRGSNAISGIVNFITEGKENKIKIQGNTHPGVLIGIRGSKFGISGNLSLERGIGERSNTDYERHSLFLDWEGFNILGTYRNIGTPGPVPNPELIPPFGDWSAMNLYDKQITKFVDGSYQKKLEFGDIGVIVSPDIRWELLEPESIYSDYFTNDTIKENDRYKTLVGQLDTKIFYRWMTLSIHLERDTILMDQYKSNQQNISWSAGDKNAGIMLASSYNFSGFNLFTSIREDWFESFGLHSSWSLGARSAGQIEGYFSLGSAFRAPTLNDLYWPNYSNDSLQPEYSIGLNAGIQSSGFSASGHIEDIKDRIGYGSDWKPHNIYKSRIYGIDIQYNQSYKNLTYTFSYSYLNGYDYYDNLTRELQYRPKHSFLGIITYKGPVNGEISSKWIGKKKKWFSNPGKWKVKGPYLVIDGSVEKKIGGVRIGFGVENILDEKYIASFGNCYNDRDYPGLGRYFNFWIEF